MVPFPLFEDKNERHHGWQPPDSNVKVWQSGLRGNDDK
jgi:hypothetical protein